MAQGIAAKAGRLEGARLAVGFAAAAAALLLAGCNSASGIADSFFNLRTSNSAENIAEVNEDFLNPGYCPQIKIRPGTESIVAFDKDGPSSENVRYQQTITRTARECHYPGGQLSLKIGVAGRVAAGPKGSAGKVVAPVRIAVVKGETVVYSELQKIEVTLAPPQMASDFSRVVDVPIASGKDERDVEIFVGFDEQGPAKKRQ